MRRKRRTAIIVLIFWGACIYGGSGEDRECVTVQLKWMHDAQFAGFYVADEHQLYDRAGLCVDLLAGGTTVNEVEAVISGAATFGVVAGAQLVKKWADGAPLVAIAVIYQINPTVYIATRESGIRSPHQFEGRRVMAFPGDVIFSAVLDHLGISLDRIALVSPSALTSAPPSSEVDVWPGYLTNEVVALRSSGVELNLIFPDDYGVHACGDTLVATRQTVEEQPEMVAAFLDATLRGWRWAIENPVDAAPLSLLYDWQLDPAHQIRVLRASIPLIHNGVRPVGSMTAEGWHEMIALFAPQSLTPIDGTSPTLFDMRFLDAIYGREQ